MRDSSSDNFESSSDRSLPRVLNHATRQSIGQTEESVVIARANSSTNLVDTSEQTQLEQTLKQTLRQRIKDPIYHQTVSYI